jgi:MYXO-CTERM domain-containing protein
MVYVGRVWSALLVAALVLFAGVPTAALMAQPAPSAEGSGATAPEGSGGLEEEVVPSFEEEIAPVLEEEIAPSFEEEIAPVLEEEIAPSFEDEVVPSLEEEIAPSFEDEVVPSLEEEIAPVPGDELPAPLTPDAEDAYYGDFWDDLDKSEPVAPSPPAVVPTGKVRITGKLVDREFGTPLDGVAVEVEGIAATARTGADGTFFFDMWAIARDNSVFDALSTNATLGGYSSDFTTTSALSYTIGEPVPAPGAFALLGAAGLLGSRRRRA